MTDEAMSPLRRRMIEDMTSPSSFVMCNTPVEVQFTSAGCLNYPCRTPPRNLRRQSPFSHSSQARRTVGWMAEHKVRRSSLMIAGLWARLNVLFAPIPVTHELISVFVKSYQ